jgi:EAL domain-containing protein (putative c-di-GMP-specific phosphodiesterase class I)
LSRPLSAASFEEWRRRREQQVFEVTLVPPSSLVIEVTEETFMNEPERVRDTLLSLHELGIELSIDDFGTGYSSLAYLRSIPANELKGSWHAHSSDTLVRGALRTGLHHASGCDL